MKCVMCPRTTLMTRRLGHMPLDLFSRITSQIAPHDGESWNDWSQHVHRDRMPGSVAIAEDRFYYEICARSLTLHGFGEPVFDPKLHEKVAFAAACELPTYFSMNPTNIRLEVIDALADAGLTYLKFSLDGMDQETQKKYRGRIDKTYDETLGKIFDVLNLLEQKNRKTRIVMTKLRFRADDPACDEFLNFWEKHNVLVYVKNQHNRWLYEEEGAPSNESEYMLRYCEFPWSSMTILYDGTVVACPLDYEGHINLGNANEQSLSEIWNGKAYQQLRAMHTDGGFPEGHFCKTQCDIPVLHEFYE
ncbi:radical SAM/SPASM domain-containing protein [Oligoflexus tunisiensis]|uniref:radical SAM/SPASM domain-containing protein n=1 Tax=Oligoflexus tunisiensis TaxID=708132 RepID=UPI001C401A90